MIAADMRQHLWDQVERIAPWLTVVGVYAAYYAFFVAIATPGKHPDEPSHLAYINSIVGGRWLPDYSPLPGGNTLPHPALYYTLIGTLTWAWGLFGDTSTAFRITYLNYLLGAASSLTLFAVARMLTPSRVAALTGTICAITIPYYTYLFTGANNDNLCTLLVFGVVYLGLRFHRDGETRYLAWASAVVLAALMTKVTGFVQTAAFLLPCFVFVARDRPLPGAVAVLRNEWCLASLACGVAYFGYTYASYGALFPAPEDFFVRAQQIAPAAFWAEPKPLGDYLSYAVTQVSIQASGIYSHEVFRYTTSPYSFWTFTYLAAVTVVSAHVIPRATRVAALSLMTMLVVFAGAHVYQLYGFNRVYHYSGGIQFRYYLPIVCLFVVAAIAFMASWCHERQQVLFCLCVAVLLAFTWHDARRFMEPAYAASRAARAFVMQPR